MDTRNLHPVTTELGTTAVEFKTRIGKLQFIGLILPTKIESDQISLLIAETDVNTELGAHLFTLLAIKGRLSDAEDIQALLDKIDPLTEHGKKLAVELSAREIFRPDQISEIFNAGRIPNGNPKAARRTPLARVLVD